MHHESGIELETLSPNCAPAQLTPTQVSPTFQSLYTACMCETFSRCLRLAQLHVSQGPKGGGLASMLTANHSACGARLLVRYAWSTAAHTAGPEGWLFWM